MSSQLWCALSALLACASAGCAVSAVEPSAPREAAAPAAWPTLDAASASDGVTWPPPYVPFDGAAPRDPATVATHDASATSVSPPASGAADASASVDATPPRDAAIAASPDAATTPTQDAATCALDPCVGHCPNSTPCCMPFGRCACMGPFGCGLPPL